MSTTPTSQHIYIPDLVSISISRDEIMEILSVSFDSSFAIPPQVLTGVPGIGKSDLALQYAHSCKDSGRYTAIRWMRMDPSSVAHEWIKFAYDMNIELSGPSLPDLIRLVYRQLQQYRYLLIFDGVEGFDSIQAFLPADAQAGQHVLITSRSEVGWPYELIVHRVDPYSPPQSIAFVRKFCEVNELHDVFDERKALAIHDTMEGLPQSLAVSMSCIAASKVSKTPMTITRFLEKYRQAQSDCGIGLKVSLKLQPLLFLYSLCVQELKLREDSAACLKLLSQLSFLGSSDCASLDLLKSLTGLSSTVDAVLLPLMHTALLHQVEGHSFRSPGIVQVTVCALLLKLDIWTTDVGLLPKFEECVVIDNSLQPLVDAMCSVLLTARDDVPSVSEERKLFKSACDACQQCENVLGLVEQMQTGDGITTARRNALQKMACALQLCITSVTVREKQFSKAWASLSSIKSKLSTCYPADNVIYGRLHYYTGLCYLNMDPTTHATNSSKTNLTEAMVSFAAALEILTAVFGETHTDVAACLSLIGLVNCRAGNYAEARDCYERVMIIQRNLYQNDMHPKLAQTLHDTAAVSLANDDTTEAILLYRESLAMKKRLYGTTHAEIALTLHQIGVIYEKELKYSDALGQYDLCLAMKRKIYGEVHETVASELFCIGVIYKKQNKYADALASLQSSLLIKRKIYDDKHLDIARILHFIGTICQEQGKYMLALEYFDDSMNMKALLSTDTDEEILDTWLCIAAVYFSQGKYVESLKTFNQCLEIQRELYPTRHPVLVRTLLGIAGIYESQGKYQHSLSNYEEALVIQRENACDGRVAAAHTLVKIAWVLRQQERYPEARSTYDEALSILKACHGESHAEVASVLSSIGNLFSCQGRYEDALMYLNHSLTIKRAVYSDGHQSIIHSEELMARIERQNDFKNKVLANFREYVAGRKMESFVVPSSLGLSFSKEDKIAAAEFVIQHIEEKGLERISGLKSTVEYKKYEGPLTDGRLGQLVKILYEEFYSSRESVQQDSLTRTRRGTI